MDQKGGAVVNGVCWQFTDLAIKSFQISRPLLGAADITNDGVKAAGLAVRSAPLADMPHHAELTGWPQGDDEDAKLQRIDIATDLADDSVYVAKA